MEEGSSLFAYSQSIPFKSTDNGQTWANPDPTTFDGYYCSIYGMEATDGYLLALLNGGVCNDGITIVVSQDNGETWTSGLYNLPITFFSLLEKNESGSCFFIWSSQTNKLFRMCNLTTGIEDNCTSNITIAPNPTNDIISISGIVGTPSVAIYNTQGKLLKRYSEVAEKNQIDLSEFSAGLYFVNVQGEKGTKSFKVIKQ